MRRRFLAALCSPQRARDSTVSGVNRINRKRPKWIILACAAVLGCAAVVFASVDSSKFTSKRTEIDLLSRLQVFAGGSLEADQITDHQQGNVWTYIGTSKEGVKLFYSPERTAKRGRLIQAWFKGEHPDTDQKVSSDISLHEFNCPRGTYRLLQGTLFFRDGSTSSSNQPSAWEHPLPNSVAEMEFKQVCRKTASRKNDRR